MKIEQALTYFKRRRDTMQLMEEDVAIWALEKQIPKKPIKDDDNMACPICGTIVGMSPYCDECGQALDWSKLEKNLSQVSDFGILIQDTTSLMNRYNDDNENCVTCKDCLNYETCVSPFKYDDTSVYFCDDFINKNCSNIEAKEKDKWVNS